MEQNLNQLGCRSVIGVFVLLLLERQTKWAQPHSTRKLAPRLLLKCFLPSGEPLNTESSCGRLPYFERKMFLLSSYFAMPWLSFSHIKKVSISINGVEAHCRRYDTNNERSCEIRVPSPLSTRFPRIPSYLPFRCWILTAFLGRSSHGTGDKKGMFVSQILVHAKSLFYFGELVLFCL